MNTPYYEKLTMVVFVILSVPPLGQGYCALTTFTHTPTGISVSVLRLIYCIYNILYSILSQHNHNTVYYNLITACELLLCGINYVIFVIKCTNTWLGILCSNNMLLPVTDIMYQCTCFTLHLLYKQICGVHCIVVRYL